MYPLISEYIDAILSAEDNMATLNNLRPVLDDRGRPVMSSGNFAVVFKMKSVDSGRCYAIKCFIKDQEGRTEAYQRICQELEFVSSPYILHVQYLENELFVDTTQTEQEEFPVLKMEWVEGKPLDVYLRENIYDNYALEMLTYRFCRMGAFLLSQPFAHGDLKPDNILVRDNGELVLVDYDGMFVPSMEGQKARELGSPDFRHPLRDEKQFDCHIDDFAIASIALSLKAITLEPTLLEKYGAADRLLFSAEDYRSLGESNVLKAITSWSSDSTLASLLSAFLLASVKSNLSMLSFRLFTIPEPEKKQIELSTEVTEDDLANAVEDEYGVKYSKDGLKLLQVQRKIDIQCYKVKSGTLVVCDCAFLWCEKIVEIVLPNSILSIGKQAFAYCKSLKELTIPQSVTNIGANAFGGCFHLTLKSISTNFSFTDNLLIDNRHNNLINCLSKSSSIILPDIVTSIGESAFGYNDSLVKIVIPNSVKIIHVGAFVCCRSLKRVVLPDTLLDIEGNAFLFCDSLEEIVLPNTLHSIGDGAFQMCFSLKQLILPESLKKIDGNPFSNNTTIISNSLHFIVENRLLIDKKEKKLIRCFTNTSHILLPTNLEYIGKESFERCNSMLELDVPDTIIAIKDYAFSGCNSLRIIKLPHSIVDIGENIFCACRSLKSIIVPQGTKQKFEKLLPNYKEKLIEQELKTGIISPAKVIVDGFGAKYTNDGSKLLKVPDYLTTYTIKEGTEVIGEYAFTSCQLMKTVILPASVTKIEKGAFMDCKSLHSIVLPDNLKSIEDSAFSGCSSLSSINIPDSVTNIGEVAFAFTSLRTIKIPNSLNRIKGLTFCGCNSLSSISLPQSITHIGHRAFENCSSLKSIDIPNSVGTIGMGCFICCDSLNSITIPDSVTTIEGYTFLKCKNLKTIKFLGVIQKTSFEVISKCYSIKSIVIPQGTKQKFEKLLPDYKDKLVEQ